MGLFDNAVKKIEEAARKDVDNFLLPGETISKFYLVKEDYCALTNKRLLFVDKSFGSSKKAVSGVPYNRISFVSLRRGGAFSISKEIVVHIGSKEIEIDLYDATQAAEIFMLLSDSITL